MTDCNIVGTLVKTVNIGGELVVQQDITATLEISDVRIGDIMVLLAATDGEQTENINIVGVNPDPGSVLFFDLPLLGAIVNGVIGQWIVTLVRKAHTTEPNEIQVELLDDTGAAAFQAFVDGGGSKTLARGRLRNVTSTTFGLGVAEEEVANKGFAGRRTFNTKGTAGSLRLAVRIDGGEDIDYDLKIQVKGKALASAA